MNYFIPMEWAPHVAAYTIGCPVEEVTAMVDAGELDVNDLVDVNRVALKRALRAVDKWANDGRV